MAGGDERDGRRLEGKDGRKADYRENVTSDEYERQAMKKGGWEKGYLKYYNARPVNDTREKCGKGRQGRCTWRRRPPSAEGGYRMWKCKRLQTV